MAKNPYTVLGVSETATDEEIRAAYRTLAKKYHPDLNPNDPEAARRMNDINIAYDQIKSADKREQYRASQTQQQQTYYQQSYYANPFENYYKTGSGYYGGSYTGGSGGDNNEPPFGWSSVFDESNRRRVYTTRVRPFRILSIILTFVLFSMFARCVLYSCLISPLYGCYGSADRTQSRSMNSSSESVSQDWIRIGD